MLSEKPNILIEGMRVSDETDLFLIIHRRGRVQGAKGTVVPEGCRARTVWESLEPCEEMWPKWISVEEKKAEFPCLCYDANGNPPFIPNGIVTITDDRGTWQLDAHLAELALHKGKVKPVLGYGNRITHWVPLPAPPKEETP